MFDQCVVVIVVVVVWLLSIVFRIIRYYYVGRKKPRIRIENVEIQ